MIIPPLIGNYQITQYFGENEAFYKARPEWKIRGHNGVDYAAPVGTPAYACADGTIFTVKTQPDGYGLYLVLRGTGETSRYDFYYAHLSAVMVSVGSTVRKGQMICRTGNSGCSTGPHLHFEVRIRGMKNEYNGAIDPLTIMSAQTTDQTQEKSITEPGTYVVNTQMNLRSAPGIEAPVVGTMYSNSTIIVTDIVAVNNSIWGRCVVYCCIKDTMNEYMKRK